VEEEDVVDQLYRERFTHGGTEGVDHSGGHQPPISSYLRAGEKSSTVLPPEYWSDVVHGDEHDQTQGMTYRNKRR
jgi:hypothetical protein